MLTILIAGQVIQEREQGSSILLWKRRQMRICEESKNIKIEDFLNTTLSFH